MMDNYKDWDDLKLIVEYRSGGDNKYIGELYKRYHHLVFGISLKYLKNATDAEDAVIGIFETLFVKLQEHQVLNFKSWLFTLCKNYLLQITQRKNRFNSVSYDEIIEKNEENFMEKDGEIHLNEEAFLEIEEKEALVREAVSKLSPEQKVCVELFYFEKLSYQDIVSKTGYDFSKVKSYIQNGKRNIKNFLDENHAS